MEIFIEVLSKISERELHEKHLDGKSRSKKIV